MSVRPERREHYHRSLLRLDAYSLKLEYGFSTLFNVVLIPDEGDLSINCGTKRCVDVRREAVTWNRTLYVVSSIPQLSHAKLGMLLQELSHSVRAGRKQDYIQVLPLLKATNSQISRFLGFVDKRSVWTISKSWRLTFVRFKPTNYLVASFRS